MHRNRVIREAFDGLLVYSKRIGLCQVWNVLVAIIHGRIKASHQKISCPAGGEDRTAERHDNNIQIYQRKGKEAPEFATCVEIAKENAGRIAQDESYGNANGSLPREKKCLSRHQKMEILLANEENVGL